LPGGLWQFFLASHGTVRYVHSAVSWPVVLANVERLPAIATMSARSLLDPRWSFVWLLVAVVFLLRRRRSLRSPDGWLLVPVASFLVLSAATFVFSRFDPWEPHLSNSIDRLALQAVPLAVWWLAAQGAAAGWLPVRESETTSSRP
jgi:hypothetical protein